MRQERRGAATGVADWSPPGPLVNQGPSGKRFVDACMKTDLSVPQMNKAQRERRKRPATTVPCQHPHNRIYECPNARTETAVKDAAQFLKVLADEARLKMLWLLFNYRELCVCDIMDALGITQSKASRHLATLRHAGLVVDRKEAAWAYYSLCPARTAFERGLLEALRAELASLPDAKQLLQHLHRHRDHGGSGASCATDCARPSPSPAKVAKRAPGPGTGRGPSR